MTTYSRTVGAIMTLAAVPTVATVPAVAAVAAVTTIATIVLLPCNTFVHICICGLSEAILQYMDKGCAILELTNFFLGRKRESSFEFVELKGSRGRDTKFSNFSRLPRFYAYGN